MSVDNPDFDDCEIIIIRNDNDNLEGEQVYKNIKPDIFENKTKIKKEDFTKICRTCLSTGELIPIFNYTVAEDNSMTVDKLLQHYLAMQIGEKDGLPPNICRVCARRLMKIHLYREKCQLNESMLRLILFNAKDDLDGNDVKTVKQEVSNENNEIEEDSNECKIELVFSQSDEDEDAQSHVTDKELVDSESLDNFGNQVHSNDSNDASKLTKKQKRHYKCYKCDLDFDTREKYLTHRRQAKHSANKIFPCKVCKKLFSTSKLNQHMRTHTKEKPYACSMCNEAFSLSGNLKRHMMIHTGERPHLCQTCGKGFIQSTSLILHQKTHRVNKDAGSYYFTCQFCGRGFKRIGPYSLHLKRHDPTCLDERGKIKTEHISDKSHKCDICNKYYRTKHLLHNHKKIHGDRDFVCNWCGKRFISNASLQLHLRTHTGEKPFVCNVCNKSFSYIGSFDTHMLIHTGFRPYSCKECGKTFTQQGHLVCHMRTHNGERPYVCSYCGKSFALNGNLTVHIRTHTGETPYICDICGKGFYDSSSRSKHQKTHESSNVTDNVSKRTKTRDEVYSTD